MSASSSSSSSSSASSSSASASSSTISRLPERHVPVKNLLDELNRCLDYLSNEQGPSIATIFPQLHQEFWRAAALIHATFPPAAPTSTPTPSPTPTRDVRNWPAWLRACLPERQLCHTLYPVFDIIIEECKNKPRCRQRFERVTTVFGGIKDQLFMLDFGPKIAGSETALGNLAKFHAHNRVISLPTISDALWDEVLSRPSLPHDEPPVPEISELTRALHKIDPTWKRRGSSADSGSTSAEPVLSIKARGKRPAVDGQFEESEEEEVEEEEVEEEEVEEEEVEEEEVESARGNISKRRRLSAVAEEEEEEEDEEADDNTFGDVVLLSPGPVDSGPGKLNSAVAEEKEEEEEEEEEDTDKARFDIIKTFIRLGDPASNSQPKPRPGSETSRAVLATFYAAAVTALQYDDRDD